MKKGKGKTKRISEIIEDPEPQLKDKIEGDVGSPNEPSVAPGAFTAAFDDEMNITAAEDDTDTRLDKILKILSHQESILKEQCEEKIKSDHSAAEEVQKRLLKKINELPEEFLNTLASESTLVDLQIPIAQNFPSCCLTKTSTSRRVVRVLSKDVDVIQSLADWTNKFNELINQYGAFTEGP